MMNNAYKNLITEILSILDEPINMPNFPAPTLGGILFWDTYLEFKGWKLQQHSFTKHARILDPDGIRRAWGTMNGMYKVMERIKQSYNK